MDMFEFLTGLVKGDSSKLYRCKLHNVTSLEPVCIIYCLYCTYMCDVVDRDGLIDLAKEHQIGLTKVPQLSRTTLEKLNPGVPYVKGPQKPLLERRNMTMKGLRYKELFYNADFLQKYWKDALYVRAAAAGEIEVFTMDKKFLGIAKLVV